MALVVQVILRISGGKLEICDHVRPGIAPDTDGGPVMFSRSLFKDLQLKFGVFGTDAGVDPLEIGRHGFHVAVGDVAHRGPDAPCIAGSGSSEAGR